MVITKYLQRVIAKANSHGVRVSFVDAMPESIRPTPVRGAFRMGEVLLPKGNPEEALFVLLHGLGHMAQWTLFPEEHERSYFYNAKCNSWDEAQLKNIGDHECMALPYVLGFLSLHHLDELRGWYMHYFVADQNYLADIFRNNLYDLEKFYAMLSKDGSGNGAHKYEELPFPVLNISQRKVGYICVL